MFLFVGDGSLWSDGILCGDIDFLCTLDLFQFWYSLIFHELFYQVFVKIFIRFGHLKRSFCFFISASINDYFSMKWDAFFFIAEFQWFLIALSVLPLSCLVNWAHWLPWFLWRRNRSHSSLLAHYSLLISGLRWLCHLSRHCFPIRPEWKWMYLAYFMRWWSISELHTWSQVFWDISLPQ